MGGNPRLSLVVYKHNHFCHFVEQASLVEIIEDNLYVHLSSLPRQMRGTDEKTKLRMLYIIMGYLQVLGDNVKTLFNTGHFLKRMSQALIQVE